VHGLRGKPSRRRIEEAVEKKAVKILSADVYQGFGPTLAAEYLRRKHGIEASKETVRQWMITGKLWRAKREKVKELHVWRPRRSRFGELIQWDTSEHDWLEGRGEKLYLIAMIDDATSRLLARFVRHDSTEENMKLLWSCLEKFGRPVTFYTDKASLFQTAKKHKRDEPGGRKMQWRCRRRRLAARCGNWASYGLRRTLPKPKGVWKETSGQPRTVW
jgi:transposase-like protein